MMRFSNLTLRNALIAVHDALATTLAVLASLYLRFEGEFFTERLPLLLRRRRLWLPDPRWWRRRQVRRRSLLRRWRLLRHSQR